MIFSRSPRSPAVERTCTRCFHGTIHELHAQRPACAVRVRGLQPVPLQRSRLPIRSRRALRFVQLLLCVGEHFTLGVQETSRASFTVCSAMYRARAWACAGSCKVTEISRTLVLRGMVTLSTERLSRSTDRAAGQLEMIDGVEKEAVPRSHQLVAT